MTDAVADMVLVVGGGTMGAGIAQNLVQVGATVTIAESGKEAAAAAVERVADGLRRTFRKDDDADDLAADCLARLDVCHELPSLEPALVIEAVPESIELKKTVLAELDARYPDADVLASNTSSLSIGELADGLTDPARVIGMHFFNPVPRSDLVELVTGPLTSAETVERAQRWVALLDKTAIVVRDSPGFATSRLGLALGLEAIRMVEEEVASAEDIDQGMMLGYKHPIGPLRLTDLVGLDVRLGIAEHLASTLGPRFEPPTVLRQMVEQGRLGKKSGEGFYTWDS